MSFNIRSTVAGAAVWVLSGVNASLPAGLHALLPQTDEPLTPTLAFGDGDCGFYEASDDLLGISTGKLFLAQNDVWLSGMNYAESDVINMFKVNEDDEIECGGALSLGAIEATEDSGAITMMDMPVSDKPASGTEMSYVFKLDGDNILKIYAEADSAGGIQNPGVVAEFQINMKEMTTPTAVPNYGALYCKSDNHLYFQDGAGVEHQVI